MLTVTVILAATVALCIAAVFGIKSQHHSEPRGDLLPKDVPQTPAASPLQSAPPGSDVSMKTGNVTIDLPADSAVGKDTSVTGTATSNDGYVYYRISDYRRGQIAAGQSIIASGTNQQYRFQPKFERVYTPGDPATLDVYVLNPDGTEQTTRIPIKLK
jgi:hypothetical protein